MLKTANKSQWKKGLPDLGGVKAPHAQRICQGAKDLQTEIKKKNFPKKTKYRSKGGVRTQKCAPIIKP